MARVTPLSLSAKVNVHGVEGVKREKRGNGSRFTIRFRVGNPQAIDVPVAHVTEVQVSYPRIFLKIGLLVCRLRNLCSREGEEVRGRLWKQICSASDA